MNNLTSKEEQAAAVTSRQQNVYNYLHGYARETIAIKMAEAVGVASKVTMGEGHISITNGSTVYTWLSRWAGLEVNGRFIFHDDAEFATC